MAVVKSIEELFGTLQQSVVAEWRKHLKADNHDVHVILDEFYKEMPEKVDKLIEDFMGHNRQKVGDYKNVLNADEYDALKYLEELHSVCDAGRKLLDKVPELESDLDDVVSLIDSCMYKLRELTKVKESFRMKSLTEFLYEALNESWSSKHGSFNAFHLKEIAKSTKWALSKVTKILDDFDEDYGGPVEWSVKDGKLIFKNTDAKKAWTCDGKKWEPTSFDDLKESKTPDERLDLDALSDTELEALVEDILKRNKDFDKKYVDKAIHALLGNGYKVTAANFISKTCKAAGDDEVHFIYSNDNNQWWDPEKGIWTAF